MHNTTLIVEDVMMMLLDDDGGSIAGAGTLPYTLGGAMIVELAQLGTIELEQIEPGITGPRVRALDHRPISDPLLQQAYAAVARKSRGVQTLLLDIGGDLYDPVIDRLIERGLIRREIRQVLRIFRRAFLPAEDTGHERALRRRIHRTLAHGHAPDPHTAAVIGLLSASDVLPALRPALSWSNNVYERAKKIEQGNWGTAAVGAAVTRTAVAIAGSNAVATTTAVNTGKS